MNDDNSTRRYLSLWLPFLAADRWRHERGFGENDIKPLVFVEKVRGASCIAASDARAHALGLTAGLSLADARARTPDLQAVPFDPASDRDFLFHLADRATAFSPTIGLDEPNGLALDITGCAHLCGGEPELVHRLETALKSAGITLCRIAVAPTPDMARALARHAPRTPCFVDDCALVRTLPVAALESEPDDTLALRRAGLKTIGDVASRPSVLFTARFSSAFTVHLDRVLGAEDRRITSLSQPPVFAAQHRCVDPITTLETVEAVLSNLAVDVSGQLRARDKGGRLFESVFTRTDGVVRRIRIETSAPTHDPAVLMRLHRDRLDALADPLDFGFGFDLIRLDVLRSEPFAASQITLDARQEQNEQTSQLIDRLSAMFGRDRVVRLRRQDTHLPERAQMIVPAADTPSCSPVTPGEGKPRPILLFKNPHPIEVEDDSESEPLAFRWRRVAHGIVRAEGPERISDEWWHAPSGYGTRDYYRVESQDGRRFWIFRAHAPHTASPAKWFLHGVFA